MTLLVGFLRGSVWLAPEELAPGEAGAGLERPGGAEDPQFCRRVLAWGLEGGLGGEGGEKVPARGPQVAPP